uniref:Uncharacterized protein n=1 Tax=Alexandrium andersonii TaxID=327968 RepID=A0A7S2HCM1_9DINO|mmetsp:Transcript_70072/g.156931  ORF Transcript_70072/g.156931 Transcript_70072/m.156931 type:complete len:163 (+) Transcript_70072:2-490(+)
MRRLERANRRAAGEAAPREQASETRPLPPPPEEGADHDRLLQLARDARGKGEMFFYFPETGDQLKKDAAKVDRACKEEGQRSEASRRRNEEDPEKSVFDFFERLETMQEDARQQKITAGEAEDPWKRSSPSGPVTSAGRPHEVVVDNGTDDEDEPEESGYPY